MNNSRKEYLKMNLLGDLYKYISKKPTQDNLKKYCYDLLEGYFPDADTSFHNVFSYYAYHFYECYLVQYGFDKCLSDYQ